MTSTISAFCFSEIGGKSDHAAGIILIVIRRSA